MSTISREPRRSTAASVRAEDAAAQCMWIYYRDHKSQLVRNIREFREIILADLMAGVPVETAFAPYVLPAEVAMPLRRAA